MTSVSTETEPLKRQCQIKKKPNQFESDYTHVTSPSLQLYSVICSKEALFNEKLCQGQDAIKT